ncbi:MAG: hypothetical protein J6M55_04735 [Paludibacteraceae bacterium]|nr:hypothetical protein [Paludibacteraceae bacterium]
MRSALSKEDIETLNELQVEAEKVLAGEQCWDSRYKAVEARVVLDGVHFIQSIEDRFDFYIGTGKALPDEMISSELNLDDPTTWIARVVDLPMGFPWDGAEISPAAFTRVIDCLKMISGQLLRIAPTKDSILLQDNISGLRSDVFRYMSGSISNEGLSRAFMYALSPISTIRVELGRIEMRRRERLLNAPHVVRSKCFAREIIPDLIDIPGGHMDVDYYARLAKRYRQLEEHWDEIEPSEFSGYDYEMRWEINEVESVVDAAEAVKFLRREIEAKQINPTRPIAHHFNKDGERAKSIMLALYNYAFNRRTRSHRIFKSILEMFVKEDWAYFMSQRHFIALESFSELDKCECEFEKSLSPQNDLSPKDAYATLIRKYEEFADELAEAERCGRPVFYSDDYASDTLYEEIEGNIKISNEDLEGINEYLSRLPDGLCTTKGLMFKSGLKFKDGFNPNANIMDGMLLGVNWFHYWTSGGPDGIQELLGANRGNWHTFFSLLGKKFAFLTEISVDARDVFDEYVNFIQDADRFDVNNAAAEVTRQNLLKNFRDVLLAISKQIVYYWDHRYTRRSANSGQKTVSLNVQTTEIVRATAIEATRVMIPHFNQLCQEQVATRTAVEKTNRNILRTATAIQKDTGKIRKGVTKLLDDYGDAGVMADHDEAKPYKCRAAGSNLEMLKSAYQLYDKGEKKGAAAKIIFTKHPVKGHTYKNLGCFTVAVSRFCDGMDRGQR